MLKPHPIYPNKQTKPESNEKKSLYFKITAIYCSIADKEARIKPGSEYGRVWVKL